MWHAAVKAEKEMYITIWANEKKKWYAYSPRWTTPYIYHPLNKVICLGGARRGGGMADGLEFFKIQYILKILLDLPQDL